MKKLVLISLICISSVFAYFIDGNTLYDNGIEYNKCNNSIRGCNTLAEGIYAGYVEGVYDSFDGILFCSPNNIRSGQVFDIVFRYLKNYPEKRNENAAGLIIESLQKVWPCKNKK